MDGQPFKMIKKHFSRPERMPFRPGVALFVLPKILIGAPLHRTNDGVGLISDQPRLMQRSDKSQMEKVLGACINESIDNETDEYTRSVRKLDTKFAELADLPSIRKLEILSKRIDIYELTSDKYQFVFWLTNTQPQSEIVELSIDSNISSVLSEKLKALRW